MSQLTAIRLLDADEPAGPLLEAVRDLAEGRFNKVTHKVEPDSFRQVPNAPFAYWVSEHIRRTFNELPPFEGDGRTARQGLATANDFRFVRLSWETSNNEASETWSPFAKGGSYSPYYADVFLMVNWRSNGDECKQYIIQRYPYLNGNAGFVAKNTDFYFRPGLTWPLRTQSGFGMRVMPEGCVFGHKGPQATGEKRTLASLLGITLSSSFRGLVEIQMAFGSYEVGVIKRTAVPSLDEQSAKHLGDSAQSAWSLKRSTDTANQTSHAFYAPALSPGQFGSRRKDAVPA
jgi:hypothetical protein